MEEIINLPVTRQSNSERVRKFYEKLSKNFDVLQTLGEGEVFKGFVLVNLKEAPQVKPDLLRTDEGWEVDRFYPNMAQAQQGRRQ